MLEQAVKLVSSGCWMAANDLRDAYYSVAIDHEFQKFLKFFWRGQLYQFTSLPNGLTSGPRKFTKLLKPPLSHLRMLGHVIVAYIDDTLLISQNVTQCETAVNDTTRVLTELGFLLNIKKIGSQASTRNIISRFHNKLWNHDCQTYPNKM